MLYVCLPTYNEAVTVGVLLWRLRTTLGEQPAARDYEIVVYDDASTDATAEVLAPYACVLPLTILRGATHAGQSAAVDALVRHVVSVSRMPESDALVLAQADYTDAPELLPAVLTAFDAGADLVLTRRVSTTDQASGERRLQRAAALLLPLLARAAVRDAAARDPAALLNVLRVFRVSVLRDALAAAGGAPLVTAPGWAGTAELAVRTAPFAPRIERLDVPAQSGVRTRASRIDWTRELRAIAALLWQERRRARRSAPGRDAAAGSRPARVSPSMPPTPDAAPGAQRAPAKASTATPSFDPPPSLDAPSLDTPSPFDTSRAASHTAPRAPQPGPRRTRERPRIKPTPAVTEPVPPVMAAVDPAPPADPADADQPAATTSSRRRRRGRRGRPAGGAGDAAAIDAASAPGETPPSEPTVNAPIANEPAVTSSDHSTDASPNALPESLPESPPGAPSDPSPKRRRRRGGSRRRAQGDPESGERPDDLAADSAPWHGAPSDQPSS